METPLPDDVVAGIRARDPDAIALCYEAVADALYRYLYARCGDHALAEDLVEATFLELIERPPLLVGGASAVRAWLFTAARNNLSDVRRKAQRRGDVALDERIAAARPDPAVGPEDRAVAGDQAAIVRAAMASLSEDQREVLMLRFAAGLSGPEVAAVTGRTVGAVKALQHRGLAALGRVLGTDPGADD